MFKVGDKVRRLEKEQDLWWRQRCREIDLTPNTVFTITEITDALNCPSLKLAGFEYKYSFKANNFILITESSLFGYKKGLYYV